MADFKEIWGFKVPITPAGRINWPNEVKRIAVVKILDEGLSNAAVALELGAHDNLVRKWCIQERRARGEDVSNRPVFAPVLLENRNSTHSQRASTANSAFCKLSFGDTVLEFPSDISPDKLKDMIRALKEAL